jgi:hypothetical protein
MHTKSSQSLDHISIHPVRADHAGTSDHKAEVRASELSSQGQSGPELSRRLLKVLYAAYAGKGRMGLRGPGTSNGIQCSHCPQI